MKVICKGLVYDLSNFDKVCDLPSAAQKNESGNLVNVKTELRVDQASKLFYIYTGVDSWHASYRKDVKVDPVSTMEAKEIAESYLDYDQYSKFFGGPEGDLMGAMRNAAKAREEAKSATDMKDYWYKEYNGKSEALNKANAEIAKLKKELSRHGTEG